MKFSRSPENPLLQLDTDAVVMRYSASVYRLALSRTGNTADAEDVMQEVFLRYITKAPAFENERHREAWLMRVTVNCSYKLLDRNRVRRTEPLEKAAFLQSFTREDAGLFEAFMRLPETYRTVLYLHCYEGYDTNELAKLLALSGAGVRMRLSRARRQLAAELEKFGG